MVDRKFTPPGDGEVREYVTRDGRLARAYLHNGLLYGDMQGCMMKWTKDGAYVFAPDVGVRLFDKPKIRDVTVWVTMYADGSRHICGYKPTLLKGSPTSRTKHTLTIAEGQFDEDG